MFIQKRTAFENRARPTLIFGDCLQCLSALSTADILLSDPPYGINYKVNERKMADPGHKLKATKMTVTVERAVARLHHYRCRHRSNRGRIALHEDRTRSR